MKALGIDYGLKKIGIAISDEGRSFAFPHSVVANDEHTLKKILAICEKEKVDTIVVGESLNLDKTENPLMKKIRPFKEDLERKSHLPVVFQEEIFTTKEAERIQGKHATLDASAAALILKSYLERNS